MAADIDTSGLERIAFATSKYSGSMDGAERWTELALYYRTPEQRSRRNPGRAFVAESIGRTTVPGETDFYRQRATRTIEQACRLFDNSRLLDEIVEQAEKWAEEHPDLAGDQPLPQIQFDGSGGLRGALLWLYPNFTREASDNQLAKRFADDFGVPERTVRHTLHQEADRAAPLPSWCLAFLGSLQHFDRDAFHKMRRV